MSSIISSFSYSEISQSSETSSSAPEAHKARRQDISPSDGSISFQVTFSPEDFKKMHKNGEKSLKEHLYLLEETSLSSDEFANSFSGSQTPFCDGSDNEQYNEQVLQLCNFSEDVEYESDDDNDVRPAPDKYYILPEAFSTLETLQNLPRLLTPLKFTHIEKTDIGVGRPDNEDRSLILATHNYIVGCIFDGFQGGATAELAKNYFADFFEKKLNEKLGNFKEATQALFNEIHSLAQKNSLYAAGTTACITIIDLHKGLIASGSLGDSEAFVYDVEQEVCFPSSCTRNWTSQKDFDRVKKEAVDKGYELNFIPANDSDDLPDPKESKAYRVNKNNNSRALGKSINNALIQKAKFTLNAVKPGNIIISASDGLWDSLSQNEIMEIVKSHKGDVEAMANVLIANAKKKMVDFGAPSDNITVVIFKVQ